MLAPINLALIKDWPFQIQEWLRALQNQVAGAGGLIPWTNISKTGSNLTELVTRNHNNLQNISGGASNDYYHLTSANYTDLTDSGDSTLHYHATDRNSSNFTGTNWTDLTDAGDTTLHFHSGDRARANHTGTQSISTLSDLPTLASGVYTPTLTNTTNLTASTAYQCQYMRVGSVVTVSGKVDVDPTLTGSTVLTITLPIASNLGAAEDCCGTAFASGIAGLGAAILGDATNDKALMQWVAADITNQSMYFTFVYRII